LGNEGESGRGRGIRKNRDTRENRRKRGRGEQGIWREDTSVLRRELY
jgi:hypothetical protein